MAKGIRISIDAIDIDDLRTKVMDFGRALGIDFQPAQQMDLKIDLPLAEAPVLKTGVSAPLEDPAPHSRGQPGNGFGG
jgi:hypothetical protein